jgi:HAD superfamily hydrolase (TIGR01549 family)
VDSIFDRVCAILFDFDGTIRHSQPSGIEVFHQLANEFGLSFSKDVKREAERWTHEYFAMSRELQDDIATTENSPGESFWQKYSLRHLRVLGAKEEGLDVLSAQIMERMDSAYQPENRIPDDVLPTLKILRDAGYLLGLVSNRSSPISDLLKELGLETAFDFTLIAGEVGYWKPDPRLLEHAVHLIGISPHEAAYVGDNYYADIVGAQAAGLWPILLDPEGLFPDPGCSVIRSLAELPSLILKDLDLQ